MSKFLGKLLVASPRLDHTLFARSVVYVFQDNAEATVGVILNRPADPRVIEAWQSLVGGVWKSGLVSIGGPIPGPIIALHQDRNAAEISLPNGVYTAAMQDNIRYLASQPNHPVHVFFGLSGWQAGQLDAEVNEGVWLTMPAVDALLFQDCDDLWSEALRCYENRFIQEVLGIRGVPRNVYDN